MGPAGPELISHILPQQVGAAETRGTTTCSVQGQAKGIHAPSKQHPSWNISSPPSELFGFLQAQRSTSGQNFLSFVGDEQSWKIAELKGNQRRHLSSFFYSKLNVQGPTDPLAMLSLHPMGESILETIPSFPFQHLLQHPPPRGATLTDEWMRLQTLRFPSSSTFAPSEPSSPCRGDTVTRKQPSSQQHQATSPLQGTRQLFCRGPRCVQWRRVSTMLPPNWGHTEPSFCSTPKPCSPDVQAVFLSQTCLNSPGRRGTQSRTL